MIRPYSSDSARSTVVEQPPGRLGKRAPWVDQSGAVSQWCGFKHLRFATPARGPLHHRRCGTLSRLLGPGQLPGLRSSRAARAGVANLRCLKPRHLPQANVPPDLRAGLLSPPEQCARIAMIASGRRLERVVGAERRARPSLGGEAVE
jgi:hypothetical protein